MSIEERAKEYQKRYFSKAHDLFQSVAKVAYTVGAEEQKVIDNAELLKLKSSWEKQAQINHDDKANYQQGYHDAIEKFCELLRSNWRKYVYRDRDGGIIFGHWESDFRKMMEE